EARWKLALARRRAPDRRQRQGAAVLGLTGSRLMHLTMLLDMAADGFGDRVVLGPANPGITCDGLRRRALRGAEIVRSHNADAVVYLAVNGAAFPVALFAAACAGVPLVPLNYRLGVEQLSGMLRRHPGALVLTEDGGHAVVDELEMPSMTTA